MDTWEAVAARGRRRAAMQHCVGLELPALRDGVAGPVAGGGQGYFRLATSTIAPFRPFVFRTDLITDIDALARVDARLAM